MNADWLDIWAALAMAAAVAALAFALRRPDSKSQRGGTGDRLLRIYLPCVILALLPILVATLASPTQPADRDPLPLEQAMVAQARALERLADTQRSFAEEARRRPACSGCGPCPTCAKATPPGGDDRRFPLSERGAAGFLLLFVGLWLAFGGLGELRRARTAKSAADDG